MPDHDLPEPLLRTAPREPHLRRASFCVLAGPDLGRTFDVPLHRGLAARGGADPACDLVLSDPAAAPLHFELTQERGRLLVRALDGDVWVGDLRVRETWLEPVGPGSSFRVGDTTLGLAALEPRELPCAPFSHLGDLDGQSDAMRVLFYRVVELAAAAERRPILLVGEAGTGKTLAAHSLHLLSPERHGPFVTLDARTLPPGQVERELLGGGPHPGALTSAAGGTLLLKAVDELPLAAQRRLAAYLTRTTLHPLARARLVATTRRDLPRLCAAGAFSRELYAHLRGEPLVLPPLRERGRDITFLAERVLARLGAAESHPRRLAPDALAALCEYGWPGNVRELRVALERAYFAARGETITRADLDLGNPADQRFARLAAALSARHSEAVEAFEAIYFRNLLAAHPSRIVAARASGMSAEGLRRACRRVRLA